MVLNWIGYTFWVGFVWSLGFDFSLIRMLCELDVGVDVLLFCILILGIAVVCFGYLVYFRLFVG